MRTLESLAPQEELLLTARHFDLINLAHCFMLYEVCNDRLIESVTMSNFVGWLNLKEPDPPICFKRGEKTRCCYFIKKVSECLTNKRFKDTWIEMMLDSIGITLAHYKAHTYEVGINEKNNRKLVEDLNYAIKQSAILCEDMDKFRDD